MIADMRTVGHVVRRLVVILAEKADEGLDEILYRPFVVKAFLWLPRWWRCDLSRLSRWLDERWGTGYRDEFGPSSILCEACRRRASYMYVGGWALESEDERGFPLDDDDEDNYLARRRVSLCGWCRLPEDLPIEDEQTLQAALAWARARSVAWRWSPALRGDPGGSG